jgi:hypothetical protein
MLITKKEFNRGIYLGYWGKLVGDYGFEENVDTEKELRECLRKQ